MIKRVQRGNFRNPSWLRFEVLESRVLLTGSPLKQELSLLLVPDYTTPALIAVLKQPETVRSDLAPAEIGDSGANNTDSSNGATQNDPGTTDFANTGANSANTTFGGITSATGTGKMVGTIIPVTKVPVADSTSPVVIYHHQSKDGKSGGTTGEIKGKQGEAQTQPGNTAGDGRSPGNPGTQSSDPGGNQSGNDSGNNSGGSAAANFDAGRFLQAMMQWEKDKGFSPSPAYSLLSNAQPEITQTAIGRESTEAKEGGIKAGLGGEENRETELAPVQVEAMASENRELADKLVVEQSPVVHLNPQGAGLLASVPSLDLVALEQGVLGFFDQLENLGNQIAKAQEKTGLPSWLVALATAGAILEITRRQIKPARTEMESAANGQDQTWTWFVDATDPHSQDPP
jgi:hypothetical protein